MFVFLITFKTTNHLLTTRDTKFIDSTTQDRNLGHYFHSIASKIAISVILRLEG